LTKYFDFKILNIQVTRIHSFTGHRDSVYALQPSDQSHLFFSGGGDGMLVRWDLQNKNDGELIAKLPNSIYALLHLPKEELIVIGQNFSGIHLIDYQSKKEVASLQITSSYIFDIQSFENKLVVATGDGTIVVIDLKKWTIDKRISVSEKSARTLAINKTTGEMAVGYSDYFIRVFSLDDYNLKHEFKAHQNSVFTVNYSPDQSLLFSGSRDARLKVWDAKSDYVLAEEVAAHMYAINHLVFSPDRKYLCTASMDKSIKVWGASDLKLLKVIDKGRHAGHGTSVNKLLWTSFNDQLVSASDDRTISAWDLLFL
jgi:WD40 repeat protein